MTEINEEGFRRAQKRLKIAMLVIPIITTIAIVLVVCWPLSSPKTEALISIPLGIVVTTFSIFCLKCFDYFDRQEIK